MGLAFSRRKHLYRRLVGMQYPLLQHFFAKCIDQGLQARATRANPGAERRLRDRQTRPRKDALLSIQRQVIAVLGDQHLSQQAGGRDALVDHMRRHRSLHQRLACLARPFSPDMPLYREHAGRVIQLLADVLADTNAFAAARTDRAVRLVMKVGTWQFRRKRCPLWLLTWRSSLLAGLQPLQLEPDCRQIRVERFLEQAQLLPVELLTAPAKLLPFDHREFVRKLVDTCLPVAQLSFFLGDLGHQLRVQFAYLFGTEGVEIGGYVHGNQSARAAPDAASETVYVLAGLKSP
ncbi:hypothetical protein AWB68_08755 [Caballeronia choica]|uniref:Uncharacterized protein n=1 Tax=Caballeronia choica TaxID=326476 RepID=A0A158L522_9BURK|nr:hypothetical protein AWB68_08755 [Caballeronia choica]